MLGIQLFFSNLQNSILSIIKVIISSKFNLRKQKTQISRCLLIGNGPSAQKTLESDLPQNLAILCLNNFVQSAYYQQLIPRYYALLDPSFVDSNHELCKNILTAISQKTDWEITLIVPFNFSKSKYFKDYFKDKKNINFQYFNYTVVSGFDFVNDFLYDSGLGMPQSQNVLVAAIFQAIRLGFQEIYITGADHSWHENIKISDINNDLILNDQHFYGQKSINYSEQFKFKSSKIRSQIANQFNSLYKVFLGHEKLANFAEKKNVKIINISQHSNIDVYNRGQISN